MAELGVDTAPQCAHRGHRRTHIRGECTDMAENGRKSRSMAGNGRERPELRVNALCDDCGSYLENWTTFYRCPWTTLTRRFSGSVDGVQAITCGWPAGAPRTEITAPLGGGRA